MLRRERLAVGLVREERLVGLEATRADVRGEPLLGMRDDEARGGRGRTSSARARPVHAAEARVEPAPARDAVDVGRDLGLRQLSNSSHASRIGFSTSPKTRKSHVARSDVGTTRRGAPATSRSGTGPAGAGRGRTRRPQPSARPWSGTRLPTLVAWPWRYGSREATRLRPQSLGPTRRVPPAHALERRTPGGGRARRSSYREGTRDRAARGSVRRDEDDFLLLTEPELGERCATSSVRGRFAANARSSPRSIRPCSSSAGGAGRASDRRLRRGRVEVLDAEPPGRRSTTRSSSASASAPARRGGGARSSTTACFRRRRGWSSAPSASRGAATRVRSPLRGCTTVVTQSRAASARTRRRGSPSDAELRMAEKASAASRAPSATRRRESWRLPTCGPRFRRTRSSSSLDAVCASSTATVLRRPALGWAARARSSGDRALPCGGRGRKVRILPGASPEAPASAGFSRPRGIGEEPGWFRSGTEAITQATAASQEPRMRVLDTGRHRCDSRQSWHWL